MLCWILCVILFAVASSGAQLDGGTEVLPSDDTVLRSHNFIVQIEYYTFWSTMEWSHQCTGIILNSRFCASTASCFFGWAFEPRFRRIRAGSSNRNTGGSIHYVWDRLNHPRWRGDYSDDISVVRLWTPLVFGPLVDQATIASPGSIIPANLRLTQLGWGRNEQPLLTRMEVITANRLSCRRRDGNISADLNAAENILCALPVGTDVTSNDDVGSPWLFGDITAGIVVGASSLDVYSGLISLDVPRYTEWIVGVVAEGF